MAELKTKVNDASVEDFLNKEDKSKRADSFALLKFFEEVKTRISDWKRESGFPQTINLTITSMQWKFDTGI